MTFTAQLLTGLAEHLDTHGVARWRPTTAYLASETAIVLGGLTPAPDRQIALTPYLEHDHASIDDSLVAVQMRLRGTPGSLTSCTDLADAVFDLLHGATNLLLGGITVTQVLRKSTAPLGVDENDRHEWSENYHLTLARPGEHRTD